MRPKGSLTICFLTLVLMMSSAPFKSPPFAEENLVMDDDLPIAKFSFVPAIPYANDTVIFDATRSTGGNGGIIAYNWDFGDNSSSIGYIIEKSYSTPGNYTVTLTITNSVGANATASKIVPVLPKPLGVEIDLYNQRGGQGPNQPSGGFAPGEIVYLSALLTYFDVPVEYKPVSFEIRDACGEAVIYRSSFTDVNGIARINFTLYSECLPCLFGTWMAVSVSTVSEQEVSDTLTFSVSGPFLDIYTQKPEPYSGRGLNQPSDAFAPQEEVCIYGEAHYSCQPIEYKLVAFEVRDPTGEVIDYRENETDQHGITMVCFRLASNATFGIYTVFGSVEILGEIATDTLTFRVGWIIEIIEFVTTDKNGAPKTVFARGEHIYINLTAENIAFVTKIATFTVAFHDVNHVPIGLVVLHDFAVAVGVSRICMFSVEIPKWVSIGVATAYANAYNDLPSVGGTPYCPETSTIFTIT